MSKTSSFPRMLPSPISARDLCALVGETQVDMIGDADVVIQSVTALDDGVPGALVFCSSRSGYRAPQLIAQSRASVLVVAIDVTAEAGRCFIKVKDPVRWFVLALHKLFMPDTRENQVHPTAIVGRDVRLGRNVGLAPYSVVGDNVTIGDDSIIGSGCFIGRNTSIGSRCVIGANTSIGASGHGMARDGRTAPVHFTHLGRVIIGDEVEIGAQCVIVRGILKDTVIEDWTKIGNLVNVGHNCHLAKNSWVAARAVLCGSVRLETNAMIGAGASINNHTVIGTDASVGLGSVVTKDVAPGTRVFGIPARPLQTMRPVV